MGSEMCIRDRSLTVYASRYPSDCVMPDAMHLAKCSCLGVSFFSAIVSDLLATKVQSNYPALNLLPARTVERKTAKSPYRHTGAF